jgi:hypothetical protein|nr:MAG TPA: hypothetical protein [Caudoviricetes sp.]
MNPKTYYDSDDFTPILAGRYVTGIVGDTMVLDDGTHLEFEGNYGCCCGSGDYDITSMFQRGTPTARIMSAEVEAHDVDPDREYSDTVYTLFVIVEDERLPLVECQGNDGNGYYGSGFTVTVTAPEQEKR